MITVYRVEHSKTRIGPFRFGKAHTVLMRKAYHVSLMPAMHSTWHGFSGLDPDRKYARNACLSAEQLRGWFGNAAGDLDALGFVVRVYTVEEVIAKDDYQCLVWLKRKRAKRTCKLSEFFS